MKATLGFLGLSTLLFFIGVAAEIITFVGLGIMCLGVMFLWLNHKGMAVAPKAVSVCGIYALVWGGLIAITPLAERLFSAGDLYIMWIFPIGFGGMFLAMGFRGAVVLPLQCSEKVTATFSNVYCKQTGKGGTYYQPEFTYRYENRSYCQKTSDIFRKRALMKRYQIGQNYTIYINPKNPNCICLKRRPEKSSFLMLAIGLVVMALPFWSAGRM